MKPEDFAEKLVSAYKNREGVFIERNNAEDFVPEGVGNKEKALFLFYVIQLDYATKSKRLYKGATKLYEEFPKFYNPSTILKLDPSELEDYLVKYLRPRYINEAMRRYKENSYKLLQEYNGNPLKIFVDKSTHNKDFSPKAQKDEEEKSHSEGGTTEESLLVKNETQVTAKETLKRVLEFRGFGPKIGNFFVRTMINTFNLEYDDVEEILPPVDRHDVKIAYLLGYTNSDKMSDKNIKKVKNIWSKACKKANVSWLVFDKTLWLLGSKVQPSSRKQILNLFS